MIFEIELNVPPIPKPRTTFLLSGTEKNPIPLSRKSLEATVKFRKQIICRNNLKPFFLDQTLSNSWPPRDEEAENDIASEKWKKQMSARAIASANKSRGCTNHNGSLGDQRPLSAYEESPETLMNRRRRASVIAVMPFVELEYRDRAIAGSCSSLLRRGVEENEHREMSNCELDEKLRELSPDFGAIRVQVEDITPIDSNFSTDEEKEDGTFNSEMTRKDELDEFDETAETSTETISEMNIAGFGRRRLKNKKNEEENEKDVDDRKVIGNEIDGNGGRKVVAEWAVPSEYASSPIAQELKQCSVDERPRPQIPAIYMNGGVVEKNQLEGNYSDVVLRRNSAISTSPSTSLTMSKPVTLLEKIIRTHTIWYLPHLGRPEVVHLLKPMEPGTFIVRASTREKCMALTVRLEAEAHVEIDHYIIEKLAIQQGTSPSSSSLSSSSCITTNVIRLEGSSKTFRSLPMLIEHYCLNDEELETRLKLPSAILACSTTKQLQSIGLMEQEFWTSEMAMARKSSRSLSRSSISSMKNNVKANNNTLPKCYDDETSTWFMDKTIYDDVYVDNRKTIESLKKNGFYGLNDTNSKRNGYLLPEDNLILKTGNKKRRSTSSRASSASSSRFATVCVGDFSYDPKNYVDPSMIGVDETDSCQSSHSPPSKHDRIENSTISRGDRRSQSVRSTKSVANESFKNSGGIGSSQTIARTSRPRSFLRSLLSFGTLSSSKDQGEKKKQEGSVTVSQLANCEYFTPWDRTRTAQVRTSRSAFDITNSPARGFFATGSSRRSTSKKRNEETPTSLAISNKVDVFDDENYTRGWKKTTLNDSEITVFKPSPGERSNISKNISTPETMKTFKPPDYDEAYTMSSKSRPLAIRKETRNDILPQKIGIIKSNAQRLAHHNESSPGPTQIKNKNTSELKVPMTPPTNVNDPHVLKSCVEELRRKRLQSTNEMLSAVIPDDQQHKSKYESNGVQSAHASPQIAMRRRNGFPSPSSTNSFNRSGFASIRNGEHRLSVPNLIAVTDPMIPGSVGQSAKALKERMARNIDGELTVINEGLVTPVVRRKDFSKITPSLIEKEKKIDRTKINDQEIEALEAIMDKRGMATKNRGEGSDSMSSGSSDQSSSLERKNSPSRKNQTESELIWRRAKQQQLINSSSTSAASWSAINYELKNRQQKVAKVLPTPQLRQTLLSSVSASTRNHQNRSHEMTAVEASSSTSSRRSSDYAQLCDFATSSGLEMPPSSPRGIYLDVPISTKIEDDAVSVAGTVFNEPWDSNVWENLLDLAHHGDDSTSAGIKVNDTIQEEDSDSDRTAGGESSTTCQMESDEDSEEENEISWTENNKKKKRALPSDQVVIKGWERDDIEEDQESLQYSTLDRNVGGKLKNGTLKRQPDGSTSSSFSMRSLPRALSRFSHNNYGMGSTGSFGSIDELPTTIPSMSPLLGAGRRCVSRQQQLNNANPITPLIFTTTTSTSSTSSDDEKVGRPVQEYVEKLSQVTEGENACFGLTLRQFIACTKETKETDPAVVVRNVRQFINGMKNYLVKHGEGDLHRIIDDESARLNSNRILNIDAVLEAVLHKLLLREVKPLLYHVMVREHSKSGTLQLISSNIGIVRKMSLKQMGFSNPESLVTPSQQTMENLKLLMRKMQNHYSPMKKLENLMKAISLIVSCQISVNNEENADPAMQRGIPAADDLVRWMVYLLSRTSTVGCELEAWYMWELLPQPILLQSDASYYLTALFSAVHVLKSAEAIRRLCEHDQQVISSIDISRNCCSSPLLSTATLTRGTSSNYGGITSAACDAFVKIAVPDEALGCVRYATFPGVPMLTTTKLSRLVAHQQGITNPEEHGLYLIADGFESCLQPTDCPVMIHEQLKKEKKPHLFAYKRHEAKIAWPRAAISAC